MAKCFHGWRISTLGKVTPADLFEKSFLDLVGEDVVSKFECLDKEWTYLFEMCTQQNRVVTAYDTDRIFLIGARNKRDGSLKSQDELDQLKGHV